VQFRDAFARMAGFEGFIAGIVFVVVCLAVTLALLLSRKRSGDTRRRDAHPVVEVGYAVLLAAVAGAIAFITASAHNALSASVVPQGATPESSTRIDVDSFQWCWRFHYAQADRSVTGVCDSGGQNLPTLVVPVGQPVQLRVTSTDVQHSFWIPDLRVKVDAFPDHVNTVTLNFDQAGQWLGRCAEYCDLFHSTMQFFVRAVPADQYQQWLAQGAHT
jgi:cytochrome c oxidase subunit 2